MLMVLFQLNNDRYAVDARYVIEIVPLVIFKSVPHAPEFVAGLFSYHGAMVPVLDLCRLMAQRECRPLLSSRIILLDYGRLAGDSVGAGKRILGLLAERVTEVCEKTGAVVASPVDVKAAPYLGDIFYHHDAINQCLKPAALLPEALRETLFVSAEQGPESGGSV